MPPDINLKMPKIAPVIGDYNISEEVKSLQVFASKSGFYIPEAFYKTFKAGDIIEVYSFPKHTQLYANKEFLKYSSYTAEAMATTPFQKLFWRDTDAQNALMERAINVATVENGPVKWDLPPHDLIESLHPRKRTFEMMMGYICPVFDQEKRVAWASSLQVQYIYEWPEPIEE